MLNIELKIIVLGVEIKKDIKTQKEFTQLQTFQKNDKGLLVPTTIKLLEVFTRKQQEDIIGKSIAINSINNGLEEYYFDYGQTGYKCSSIDILKEKLADNFLVSRSFKVKVDSVIPMLDKSGNLTKVKLQSMVKNDLSFKIIDISIKEQSLKDLEVFKGKVVIISDIKVVSMDHKKYYSSANLPTLAK